MSGSPRTRDALRAIRKLLALVGVLMAGCSGSPVTSSSSPQGQNSLRKDDLEVLFKEIDEASRAPDSEVDIAQMSLKIARIAYPSLNIEGCSRKLDELA